MKNDKREGKVYRGGKKELNILIKIKICIILSECKDMG